MVPNHPKAPIFLQTIEENLKKYSQHQIKEAHRARDLLHALSFPSIANLKKALQMNAIANCPVTIDDVTRAEDIFGPDIATLKGKTTRHKPSPYVEEVVNIPPELISEQQVHLCIDTFFVNEIPFLTTISRHIKYRMCTLIPERKVTSYLNAL
jgi:hypothetical protein